MSKSWSITAAFLLAFCCTVTLVAQESELDSIYDATLTVYSSPEAMSSPVDRTTLDHKVMCGYQGWFNAAGDGADRGWVHWNRDSQQIADGHVSFDLWPDMSELTEGEKFPTEFFLADGQPANLFSSFLEPTVRRHFQWMQQYDIDGVFVQRFAATLRDPNSLKHNNIVLGHCRNGANEFGRTYAVMYDLSGLRRNETDVVKQDWLQLRSKMQITEDPAYLHHNGKPVVAIWGIGFNDNRRYTLQECDELLDFFQSEESTGACTLMIGIPTYWRTLSRDSLPDPMLHHICQKADILSPWTVGRYADLASADSYATSTLTADLEWCASHSVDLNPVVFPGFSWHNLQPNAPSNQIPRRKGDFLWRQISNAKRAGAKMVYVAMFDEVDEGTAIFKCTNNPPESKISQFVDYEGLPSDYYLQLTGRASRWIRGDEKFDYEYLPQGN